MERVHRPRLQPLLDHATGGDAARLPQAAVLPDPDQRGHSPLLPRRASVARDRRRLQVDHIRTGLQRALLLRLRLDRLQPGGPAGHDDALQPPDRQGGHRLPQHLRGVRQGGMEEPGLQAQPGRPITLSPAVYDAGVDPAVTLSPESPQQRTAYFDTRMADNTGVVTAQGCGAKISNEKW